MLMMTKNLKGILSLMNETSLIIPGHGPLATKLDLISFIDMLSGTSEGPKENLAKKMVELSKELILPSISFFNESTAANTAIIEKIPMVTPSNDKKVLSLLFTKALIAK